MQTINVDIVSDVVCPWCIVGLKQLEQAAGSADIKLDIHWHPFELNRDMPDDGQNLQEHICEKYGMTVEHSNENRARLTQIGNELGFEFNFTVQSRMVNTFKAHQLLHWANLSEREHELKQALFNAYFTDQLDISDTDVLVNIIGTMGMDEDQARQILKEGQYEQDVRQAQAQWIQQGISSVPAMVFNRKYLASGAQGVDNYTKLLQTLIAEGSPS